MEAEAAGGRGGGRSSTGHRRGHEAVNAAHVRAEPGAAAEENYSTPTTGCTLE